MASNALRVRELADETPWAVVLEAFIGAAANSPHTARTYRRHCVGACRYLGIRSLTELNGAMLAEYRASIVTDRSLAPGSRNIALGAFRSFLRWSWVIGAHRMEERVILMSLKGTRAVVKTPYRVLSPEDLSKVWRVAADDPRDLALLSVTLGAGLRTSEVAHLTVADCYESVEGGPALHVRQGKGGRDRIVPLRPQAFAYLLAYLNSTSRDLAAGGPLFLARDPKASDRDGQLSVSGTGVIVRSLLLRAGVGGRRVAVHSLRHQYALSVLRNSGNVGAVQALLGHANIATTMRYVDHLRLAELRTAVPDLTDGPST